MQRMLILVLALLLVPAAMTSRAGEVLTNQTVVEMVQLHLADEIVVRKIETSLCQFDTTPQALAQLQAAGVPATVIGAMLSAGSPAASTASAPAAAAAAPAARTPEFGLLLGNGYRSMAATPVSSESSRRKKWIPIYGSYAGTETFFFIKGVHAATVTGPRPVFVTTIEPSRMRLVHLGVRDDEERYVVFAKGRSDREIAVTAEPSSAGAYHLSPSQALEPGEYAWLVTPSAPQSGQSVLAVALAAQIGGMWTSGYDFSVQ